MVDPFSYFSYQPVLHSWCVLSCLCNGTCVERGAHDVVGAGFLTRYQFGSSPYVQHHITKNENVLSESLNKHFLPSIRSEMQLHGKSVRSWCDGSLDRSFMVDPLSYFSFQPVPHDWCNKDRGMCYPVCGMMHIKEPLLLSERVAHVAGFLSRYLNGPLSYA